MTRLKYLGSRITEDAKSGVDITARVGMTKAAFWQNKELMRCNIRLSTKMKILNSMYSQYWIMDVRVGLRIDGCA